MTADEQRAVAVGPAVAAPERDLGPAVRFPPPLPYVMAFLLGALLDRVAPLPRQLPAWIRMPRLGLVLMVGGIALVFAGIVTFRRHRTAVYPNRPARSLVTTGVYAHTRNPMYLGFTVAYLGGVIATGQTWPLLLLPVVLSLILLLVIAREEEHLHERFPVEYDAYASRVRRWL